MSRIARLIGNRSWTVVGAGRDELLFAANAILYAVHDAAGSGHIRWQKQLPSEPSNLALADVED
jgi:hypothetical protein